jgi:hypothetical protein
VYARRRILAILVVLLLLALLLPRACQALMGSDNEARGPGGEQQAAAPGTDDAGAGTGEGNDSGNAGTDDAGTSDAEKNEGAGEAKDEPSDRGVPFLDDGPDGEHGAGGDEAAPDLLALVTPTVGDEDASAGEEGGSGGSSPGTGGEPPVDKEPISELQFALAASPAPQQAPSGEERAPTRRSGPAQTAPVAEQDAASRGERIRARADRLAATRVAEPAALDGSGPAHAVVESAAVESAAAESAAAESAAAESFGTVSVAPAQATVPVAVSRGPAFAPTRVSGALNGGRGPGALPAGPRLAGPGPTGTPGPAF